MTGHVANFEKENGISEQRISVKGSEHNKAGIEHNFTIVLFADVMTLDNKRSYIYHFHSDGITTAKTPPMFLNEGEERMENEDPQPKFLAYLPKDIDSTEFEIILLVEVVKPREKKVVTKYEI